MWLVWMLGGCGVLERLLPRETVHIAGPGRWNGTCMFYCEITGPAS